MIPGSIGYTDRYSDLNFAIVIEYTNINTIFEKNLEDIKEKYNISFFDNMKNRRLQLFLLDNYLEIDIRYYSLDYIHTKREKYKVIYDKFNKSEETMKTIGN